MTFEPELPQANGVIRDSLSLLPCEIAMDSGRRRRFGGIRNLLLELEFLDHDFDGVPYWIAAQYLPIFLETKSVEAKKLATSEAEQKSSGMKLVEKYHPRLSRLTDAERQRLMARGLQIIYGDIPAL